jgi:hypothetical protein
VHFKKAWAALVATDDPPSTEVEVRSIEEIERSDRETDVALKRQYALSLLRLLRWQFVTTNGVFVVYANWGVHWRIPDAVILGWIGSTVVELVGVIAIVTRYLFPGPTKDAE